MGKGKIKDVNDKLRVSVSTSRLICHNYINKITKVMVKNIYQYT